MLFQTVGLGNILDESVPMIVFTPQNRAWDSFPPGTLNYLMSGEVSFIAGMGAILTVFHIAVLQYSILSIVK